MVEELTCSHISILCQWFGYDASQNSCVYFTPSVSEPGPEMYFSFSWTTEDSFTKGSDIVRSFWRDVNPGRESTAPSVMVRSVGYRVKSSKEWKSSQHRAGFRHRLLICWQTDALGMPSAHARRFFDHYLRPEVLLLYFSNE